MPVGVVDDADHPSAEDLKEALARVEEVMTEAGADVETILRVDDSVAEGFVAAAAEKEATMLLVPWEGPGGQTGPAWGRAVDSIGRDSPVPTAAVRSNSDPWERIFLIAYFADRAANNDLRLALGVLGRLAAGNELPVVICTDDGDRVEALAGKVEAEIRMAPFHSGRIVAQIQPGDLVVVPLGVARRIETAGLARLGASIGGAAVMVVAGPGRLSFGYAARSGLAGAIVAISRR